MSSTKSIRRRLSADERREQIDQAAKAIARESGLVPLTVRALASRIGVAPGLVAHYEPSMDELTARTFAAICADERAEIGEMLAGVSRGDARLVVLLDTLLDPRRADVTLVWMQAWVLGGRNEVLAEAARREMDAWEALFVDVLSTLTNHSSEDDRVDAVELARQVLGMMDGLNAHALVKWNPHQNRLAMLLQAVEAMLHRPAGSLTGLVV